MQPQQYPPAPGYAPAPQPQYAQPQYAPPPAPAYAPPAPQPQYAPQSAPQAYAGTPAPAAPAYNPAQPVAPVDVNLGAPDPTSGGNVPRPTLEGMGVGRLVLFAPTKLERNVPDQDEPQNPAKAKDRLTVDLVVLDGPPIPMGGSTQRQRPHTAQLEIPGEVRGAWLSHTVLVPQLVSKLNPRPTDAVGTLVGNTGLALGRLNQVPTKRNPAWVLDAATPADEAICRQYLAWAVANGTWFANLYVPAARAAAGAMANVSAPTAQSQAPAPQYAPPAPQPQYAPQPTAPAAAPGQYGPPAYTAPAPPQAAPQPQYAPPPPPAAAPAPQGVANPGYDPAAWAQADEATRVSWAQQWAAQHGQTPAPGTPAGW